MLWQQDEDGKAREKYKQHGKWVPLDQKAKPAQSFHTSRNSPSLTEPVNQLSLTYWCLLHQQELYSQHGAQGTEPAGTSVLSAPS